MLGRLEENRVHRLATSHARSQELAAARAGLEELRGRTPSFSPGHADLKPARDGTQAELARLRAKVAGQERVLRALLDSGGLRVADRISALRHPRRDWSWPGRLRTALGGPGHEPDHARPAPHRGGATEAEAPAGVTWKSDERCVVAGITFQAIPPEPGDSNRSSISTQGADFLLFKPRPLIERYVEWIEELRPRNIVELGILEEESHCVPPWARTPAPSGRNRPKARPRCRRSPTSLRARAWIEELRVHTDVTSPTAGVSPPTSTMRSATNPSTWSSTTAHTSTSRRGPRSTNCSRGCGPAGSTRSRTGGGRTGELGAGPVEGMSADETPLTRLIFELLLAIPAAPGLIADLNVQLRTVEVRRGDAVVDPGGPTISS